MRSQQKGMTAIMDAMFFILILAMAVSAIFAYMPDDPDEPFAERIHRDIFATELRVSDVFDINDDRVVPLEQIVAACIRTGEGNIEAYLYSLLKSMIPVSNGFELRCEYGGSVMIVGEGEGVLSSYYSYERIVYGETLITSVTIR